MASVEAADQPSRVGGSCARRLYVAWQNPVSRAISPVGALMRYEDGTHEFRYMRQADVLPDFRPFVAFPDLHRVYRSRELFPFFENRLLPKDRSDFPAFVASLDLQVDADPFEILARTQGRRATDTVEVFPEPVADDAGTVVVRFLVRGVRHIRDAQDAIDDLESGDELRVLLDPQNAVDRFAVLLRTEDVRLVGWIPAYLTRLVHSSLAHDGGPSVVVERIGDRLGPVHLRLLCRLEMDWGQPGPVLSGPEFDLLGTGLPSAVRHG